MQKIERKQPSLENAPALNSVAIIMDGNGRWARRRGMPRNYGHVKGAENVERVLKVFRELGVRHLTLYAFSTENWRRPKEEVDGLMALFYRHLDELASKRLLEDTELSLRFLGDKSPLPEKLRQKCIEIEELTAGRPFVCNIALNYGGRDEILHAVNECIKEGAREITPELLSSHLYTAHSPDPDLLIRTGGDLRISNFLLWQSAYTEFVFTDTLWPDFDREAILRAVDEFYHRKRRFGGLDKEENK